MNLTCVVNLLFETDFAVPAATCILLYSCLLLAEGKFPLGSVYGLDTTICIAMYTLLALMTTEGTVTRGSVVSSCLLYPA